MHPGPQRRKFAVEHMSPGVKLGLRSVIIIGGIHRANESDVTATFANVRETNH
jgi:hypothetical protein